MGTYKHSGIGFAMKSYPMFVCMFMSKQEKLTQ